MSGQSNTARPTSNRTGETARALIACLSPAALVRENEPLAKRTTLRVGGPADIFVEPGSETDLGVVVRLCAERSLPFFVLGRGSNLLVQDGGFSGVVVCLAHESFRRVEVAGTEIRAGAGARLKTIAAEAKRYSLTGLEFLDGIPGSVGGALRMNAGAMGNSIFDRVRYVRLMDFKGHISERTAAEMNARYRGCDSLKEYIALAAVLNGQPGELEGIERRMNEFNQRRWHSQPAAPSAGCMFKNPASIPAGRLIDELGLKGARVGGAMVSLEHGNFLVNDGTATAAEILQLIALIRTRAQTERGISLELEVQVIGDPAPTAG
jgi:UDP-N-acetylenolpyruvoylglucosamine reductase